jgi:hypothetical protein
VGSNPTLSVQETLHNHAQARAAGCISPLKLCFDWNTEAMIGTKRRIIGPI